MLLFIMLIMALCYETGCLKLSPFNVYLLLTFEVSSASKQSANNHRYNLVLFAQWYSLSTKHGLLYDCIILSHFQNKARQWRTWVRAVLNCRKPIDSVCLVPFRFVSGGKIGKLGTLLKVTPRNYSQFQKTAVARRRSSRAVYILSLIHI